MSKSENISYEYKQETKEESLKRYQKAISEKSKSRVNERGTAYLLSAFGIVALIGGAVAFVDAVERKNSILDGIELAFGAFVVAAGAVAVGAAGHKFNYATQLGQEIQTEEMKKFLVSNEFGVASILSTQRMLSEQASQIAAVPAE